MPDEIKSSTTIVTGETLAAFQAQKLGLAPIAAAENKPAEPVSASESSEGKKEPVVAQQEESGEPLEKEPLQKPAKPKNEKLERRFSEITQERNAAREEARKEREEKAALQAKIRELEGKNAPPEKVTGIDKPRPDQFKDAFEYAEALAAYSAQKALADRDAQEKKEAETRRIEQVKSDWAKRQKAVIAEHPDYEEVLAQSDAAFSDPVRDAIMESEFGPQMLYALAQDSELVSKINSATVVGALRMIGRLEARFEKAADPVPPPPGEKVVPAVKPSKAPPPITPLSSTNSSVDNLVDSDGNFLGTPAQYRELRKAGKIK